MKLIYTCIHISHVDPYDLKSLIILISDVVLFVVIRAVSQSLLTFSNHAKYISDNHIRGKFSTGKPILKGSDIFPPINMKHGKSL